jgi:transcriptional regulator with XRE-family HTH domain
MAKSFKELFAAAKQSADYWAEIAAIDFTADINRKMKALEVSRSDLAARIGTSPAYVTKIMNGTTNFTLKSMVTLAHALGQKVKITIEDEMAEEGAYFDQAMYGCKEALLSRGTLLLIEKHQAVDIQATNEDYLSMELKVA